MPYKPFKNGNEYGVYKVGPKGRRMGKSLGNHDTLKGAYQQIADIESDESKAKEYDEIGAEREYALQIVANGMAYAGRFDEALAVAGYIDNHSIKAYVYRTIAEAMYQAQDVRTDEVFAYARQEALMIENEYVQAYVLSGLVQVLVYCDRLDMALDVALSIGGEMQKEVIKTLYKAFQIHRAEGSKVYFKEAEDGSIWMVGLYSNKFEDRQGEILSEASHLDYIDWANTKGFKPVITMYHLPRQRPGFWHAVMKAYEDGRLETDVVNNVVRSVFREYAIAEVQHLFYSNGFAGVLAKVYDHRIEGVKRLMTGQYDLGMSHGFTLIELNDNIYTKYRSFEMTVLLRDRAANENTELFFEEDKAVREEDKKVLAEVLGDEVVAEIERDTSVKGADLQNRGVNFKEGDEAEEVPANEDAGVEEPVEEKSDEAQTESDAEFVDTVNKMAQALGLPQLNEILVERFNAFEEKIAELEGQIEALKADEDTKIAQQYIPTFDWMKIARPTQDEANVRSNGEQKKATEDYGWLRDGFWPGLAK